MQLKTQAPIHEAAFRALAFGRLIFSDVDVTALDAMVNDAMTLLIVAHLVPAIVVN